MKFILTIILITLSAQIFAQSSEFSLVQDSMNYKGYIEGVVLDIENNNKPLGFAQVYIENVSVEKNTNLKGEFNVNLAAGFYVIVVRFSGYKSHRIENVEVKANQTSKIKVSLSALELKQDVFSDLSLIAN